MTAKENTASVKRPEKTELTELEILKAKLEELESKLSKNINNSNASKSKDEKIESDEYISVMSLIPYPLNLSTEGNGQGSIKRFTHFGEVKRIIYRDLVDIMDSNTKFVESGYFYIMNPAVVRRHGLDDIYSKILTKEKIEEILLANSEHCVELYNSANKKQQHMIIELLVNKIVEDSDSVNLNIIDRFSRESDINIMEKVENIKQSRKAREELAKNSN